MKTFVWINGSNCQIIERSTLESAKETVFNCGDHSKENILREITNFTDYSRIYTNIAKY